MPITNAFFLIRRTMGKLTFYMMDGKNYVRKKSSLSAKRVKKSPQYARTRYYARLMATASGIGSKIYQALPPRWRQSWMYRAFTGEAMQLLKDGKTKEEAAGILWQLYVQPLQIILDKKADKCAMPIVPEKRQYVKKDANYWHRKSEKAIKRKAQQGKLHYYAGLMRRAAAIGASTYRNIPEIRRGIRLYKLLTGLAMWCLQEGMTDIEAEKMLMNEIKVMPNTEKKKSLFVIPYSKNEFRQRRYMYRSGQKNHLFQRVGLCKR